ncbi:hypothetical protein EAY24_23920 [Vibrio anguillarum]|uniref:YokE-like PH domain-containing protein n=5 Tax=Vibrio anguillarum TaxID=55601 RepID=A0A289GF01_VIBAN|nr:MULTISPECIES: hypothetical protein [Vibrio]ASW82110.1 hypothetical protein CK207_13835 [Vibrio anguillarum]AZS24667.1 hypothetical protein DYL72_06045 [Vibrio anguillarum]MBF4256235.1 hypothetical protein [Vibrio anguillarum]MBF4264766.1 hypothetical protein [Vibrio anguillarum]MBF4275158.1 hypothetical protein [Vibrio anguillarum]
MIKEQAKEYIEEKMNKDDQLIGFFQAVSPPQFWLFLLVGPLFVLSMRTYFLAVTEKGISFHKLSLLGKFKEHDFFEFSEIESVKIGKGLLQRPMKFTFQNNRKITVRAQLKGVGKVAKLLPEVQQYIESRMTLSQ